MHLFLSNNLKIIMHTYRHSFRPSFSFETKHLQDLENPVSLICLKSISEEEIQIRYLYL